MSYWSWTLVFIVFVFIIPILQQIYVMKPGRELKKKFMAMGKLAGLKKTEIIWSVGPPNSFSALSDGKTLLQWQATGYHIALIFRDDICEGVTHEFNQ